MGVRDDLFDDFWSFFHLSFGSIVTYVGGAYFGEARLAVMLVFGFALLKEAIDIRVKRQTKSQTLGDVLEYLVGAFISMLLLV